MISFKAHCARNHDRIDFTEPAAFEAHMTTEHKARRLNPGSMSSHLYDKRTAPGWRGGKPEQPYPWAAPKPERNGLEKIAQRIAAGEYVWPESEWSFRKPEPAVEATPAA